MTSTAKRRFELIRSLERRIRKRGLPRLEMSAITFLTGVAAFTASFVMLRLGVEALWIRYLTAAVLAWLVFLGLLRVWLHWHGRRIGDADLSDLTPDSIPDLRQLPRAGWQGAGGRFGGGGGGRFGGAGASSSFEKAPAFLAPRSPPPAPAQASTSGGIDLDLELDDWILVVVVLALLTVILLAAIWVIYIAPSFLAEMLVDTALARGLYRKLPGMVSGSWLLTAIRRTAWLFAAVGVLTSCAGWFIQYQLPAARSIGDVWRLLGS